MCDLYYSTIKKKQRNDVAKGVKYYNQKKNLLNASFQLYISSGALSHPSRYINIIHFSGIPNVVWYYVIAVARCSRWFFLNMFIILLLLLLYYITLYLYRIAPLRRGGPIYSGFPSRCITLWYGYNYSSVFWIYH